VNVTVCELDQMKTSALVITASAKAEKGV
jgi:hypothetical protein